MVLETVLILYYQTKHGVLYRDIGWLLMSFMTGLALGSPAVKKAMLCSTGEKEKTEIWGGALIAMLCLLCFYMMKISDGLTVGLFQISVLLVFDGFVVAGIFAYASSNPWRIRKNHCPAVRRRSCRWLPGIGFSRSPADSSGWHPRNNICDADFSGTGRDSFIKNLSHNIALIASGHLYPRHHGAFQSAGTFCTGFDVFLIQQTFQFPLKFLGILPVPVSDPVRFNG